MTDEELQEKMRLYNALLRAYGTQAAVFSRLNAAMLGDSRIEMKQLLEEVGIELARRQDETQGKAATGF